MSNKYKPFLTERDGQIDFFEAFGVPWQTDEVLVDRTDGVFNGNIFEFKKKIDDLNEVLFQAIKYLSHRRVKGEDVPANILLVSLNERKLYLYHSKDYFDDIHKVYQGAASKNNKGFVAKDADGEYDYADKQDFSGAIEVKKLLNETEIMPIEIDENCIVGWAERYYKEVPNAQKADFIGEGDNPGEIREPKHFKGLIKAYEHDSNEKFKYLMDMLNEDLRKKDLGAFYTPPRYCEKAAELVQKAIERVPDGNDYIIIDRCAGSGNLEAALNDDVLSHCVLSTYEYYEYKVLQERLGDKVRMIIPPTDNQVIYSAGYVMNADAMSKDFVEMSVVKEYINDPNITIIVFENPPYAETSSVEHQKKGAGKSSSSWKDGYVPQEMKKAIRADKNIDGRSTNDMANVFIWSAFKYYLRQPTDSLVVFSPVKYWKYQHVIDRKFIDGFLFNRKHFHATGASAVACVLWANEEASNEKITLHAYDIDDKGTKDQQDDVLINLGKDVEVKKTHSLLSSFYDKRKFSDDVAGITCELNGTERHGKSSFSNAVHNTNIVGYLITKAATFENPRLKTNLTRVAEYDGHGFYLRSDNYLEKLPMFAAAKYPIERDWTENGVIYKSFDGGDSFTKDKEFLDDCFLFTCLSYYNKCRSFTGSDGRFYRNELCFDGDETLASKHLTTISLSKEEKELVALYRKILAEAKKTANYDIDLSYGIYQIDLELNTTHKETDANGKEKTVYDYPKLNGDLKSLRVKLDAYYDKSIAPKCFKYELLK